MFSWIGLSYFDPPISYGMEVSFGTSSEGKRTTQLKNSSKKLQQQEVKLKTETLKSIPNITELKTPKVLSQKEASIPLANKNTQKKLNLKVSESVDLEKEINTEVEKEEPPEPFVSKSTKQVLSNLFNNTNKSLETNQSDGNDEVSGVKGETEGSPYASSYYGKAGIGGKGTGFGLNGRNLQNQGSVIQECNEEGIVVVRISVDKFGNVFAAEAGVKGTTNSHPCLLAPAEKTAYLHKWFSDPNAPSKQTGFVVVNFKLGE
tara:strand:+ start:3453 stop:4235 length:783 start_codon:yes stop_codon:yes gene_type:complete